MCISACTLGKAKPAFRSFVANIAKRQLHLLHGFRSALARQGAPIVVLGLSHFTGFALRPLVDTSCWACNRGQSQSKALRG